MGFWPVSFSVEIVLLAIVAFLWKGRSPSRLLALACLIIEVPLWLARQELWSFDGGVFNRIGIFYPLGIITILPMLFILFSYVALVNLFESMDRDRYGRRVAKKE